MKRGESIEALKFYLGLPTYKVDISKLYVKHHQTETTYCVDLLNDGGVYGSIVRMHCPIHKEDNQPKSIYMPYIMDEMASTINPQINKKYYKALHKKLEQAKFFYVPYIMDDNTKIISDSSKIKIPDIIFPKH